MGEIFMLFNNLAASVFGIANCGQGTQVRVADQILLC